MEHLQVDVGSWTFNTSDQYWEQRPTVSTNDNKGSHVAIIFDGEMKEVILEVCELVENEDGEAEPSDEPFIATKAAVAWKYEVVRGAMAGLLAQHTTVDVSGGLAAFDALWPHIEPKQEPSDPNIAQFGRYCAERFDKAYSHFSTISFTSGDKQVVLVFDKMDDVLAIDLVDEGGDGMDEDMLEMKIRKWDAQSLFGKLATLHVVGGAVVSASDLVDLMAAIKVVADWLVD